MNITLRETVKSAAIGAISILLTGLITVLQSGSFTWETVKPALIAGVVAFVSAIIKYFSTDTVQSAAKDIQEAIKPDTQVTITKQEINTPA